MSISERIHCIATDYTNSEIATVDDSKIWNDTTSLTVEWGKNAVYDAC